MRDIIGEFFYFYYFCRDMITSELNKVVSKVLATTSLPAVTVADSLAEALRSVHAAVVVAPPGAGKSTLLPLSLLRSHQSGRIVMLEPRRIAARQVAARMAAMLGERVGQTVGYQIRFERKVSAMTRIEVVTEGVLARRLAEDPTLDGVDCVVFDEFHERSIQSDLTLCMVRQVRDVLRPDLNVVVMSATIDTTVLCRQLGAKEVSCEGRMFPVRVVQASEDTPKENIAEAVATTVVHAHSSHEGDILAFLPGQGDIERCAALLGDSLAPTRICPLYGNMSMEKQAEAIAASPSGSRKVVLATPVAETSLTIEGVRVVVDSGYCRRLLYDAATGLSHLVTVRISHDMAMQRTGRAGRVAPGVCYRLWTLATDARMEEHRRPEISDADLTPMVLTLAAFGETHPATMPWLTPPPEMSLRRATEELRLLGAIDDKGTITALGRRMEAMPCHPRIAKMIVHAADDASKALACDIAAILEEKDVMSADDVHADLLPRVAALRDARRGGRLGPWSRVARVADEYRRMAHVRSDNSFVGSEDIGVLVAAAYPERIAMAVDHNGTYRLAGGATVRLDASDSLTGYEWIAVASLHGGGRGVGRVFLAAAVGKDDVEAMASWTDNLTWITHQGGVVARRELRIGQLVIESRPLTTVDDKLLTDLVCDAVAREGQSLLDWNEDVSMLQRRVALVARWHPDLGLPDISTDHLLATAADWLPFYLHADGHIITTVAALRRIPLAQVLWSILPFDAQQTVDRLAPARIRVPSGSMVKVDYRVGSDVPVLSVRLQECFGLAATPCVDGGRVPVLMELLSPGFKPVQLTTDLASFWQNAYFEVRKELRRRYPKHYWPDNPLEAEATRGVKRRK